MTTLTDDLRKVREALEDLERTAGIPSMRADPARIAARESLTLLDSLIDRAGVFDEVGEALHKYIFTTLCREKYRLKELGIELDIADVMQILEPLIERVIKHTVPEEVRDIIFRIRYLRDFDTKQQFPLIQNLITDAETVYQKLISTTIMKQTTVKGE